MILTIYLIGLVIVLIGGLYVLRETQDEIDTGEVFAVLCISVLWFIMIPVGCFISVLDWTAKLLSKEKK